MSNVKRKLVQIAVGPADGTVDHILQYSLYGLDDQGSAWVLHMPVCATDSAQWKHIPDLPIRGKET